MRRVNQEEIHRLGSVGIQMLVFAFRLYFGTLKKIKINSGVVF